MNSVVNLIINLVITLIPAIIAYYKKNNNAKLILKCVIALEIVSFVIGLAASLISILGIVQSVWSIINLVLWIYLIICAVKDTKPTIFEMIGLK